MTLAPAINWSYAPAAWAPQSIPAETLNIFRNAGRGVFTTSGRTLRRVDLRPVDDRPAEWVVPVLLRITSLVNSDRRISRPALVSVIEVVTDPIWFEAPQPLVGTTEQGGFVLEFRTGDTEFHVEVLPTGEREVYALAGSWEWEGAYNDLPDGIEKWAWRLSQAHAHA